MSGRGWVPQRVGDGPLRQGALAVYGLSEGIHDPASPGQGRTQGTALGQDADLRAGGHALHRAEGHQERPVLPEAHHLGGEGRGVVAIDIHPRPHGQTGQPAPGLDQQTMHGGHPAGHLDGIDPLNSGDQATQSKAPHDVRQLR